MASNFSRIQAHRIPQFCRRFLNIAAASLKDTSQLFNECNELMTWLRRKTGFEISSVLAIGTSSYGRSLFASKPIEDGDCILKIPYTAHLTPDKILPEVESLIVDDVGTISRLAVVLLAEQKLGKNSDWFPYLKNLPHAVNMHNTLPGKQKVVAWNPRSWKPLAGSGGIRTVERSCRTIRNPG